MASTEEKVINIIAGQLGSDAATITAETDIANDLGADSLDLAELMIAFEEEFNINIDESDAQNITTVGDVIQHIEKAIKEN
ncbi:MAG: acyl carrier protein [Planctomycetaceae bacterium]|jgi:acyl carrier protein|nr:acyl carrier protein [Planctomycetaceae bacterium]MDR2754453.1 acyl carrier protein [Planctomycetaceae bacterium]